MRYYPAYLHLFTCVCFMRVVDVHSTLTTSADKLMLRDNMQQFITSHISATFVYCTLNPSCSLLNPCDVVLNPSQAASCLCLLQGCGGPSEGVP